MAVNVNGKEVYNRLFQGGAIEFDVEPDPRAIFNTIQIRLFPVKDSDGELGIGLLDFMLTSEKF